MRHTSSPYDIDDVYLAHERAGHYGKKPVYMNGNLRLSVFNKRMLFNKF